MNSLKKCIFAALEIIGDQSSLDHLKELVETRFVPLFLDHIVERQQCVIKQTGLTQKAFYTMLENGKLAKQFPEACFEFERLAAKWCDADDVLTKSYLGTYRQLWRKEKGIERDCRTYVGQPKRNMIKKAA